MIILPLLLCTAFIIGTLKLYLYYADKYKWPPYWAFLLLIIDMGILLEVMYWIEHFTKN